MFKPLKNSGRKYYYPLSQIGSYTYSQSSSLLGKTKNSRVYMGYHSITEKEVAIKVLNIQGKQKHQKCMIKDEIKMLTLFKNCNKIIEVYDVYQTQRHVYIVMQVCDGDLENALLNENNSGFQEDEAKQIMNQILDGYKQILNKKIIHRDMKTANVFLKNKQIKLADFGYAIKADISMKNGLRLVKDNAGSPSYMSPQALIKNIYSFKSDIWSLGIIYYQLLTGRVPWNAKTEADLIRQLKQFDINQRLPQGISKQSQQFLIETLSIPIDLRMSAQKIMQFQFQIKNEIDTVDNKQQKQIFKYIHYNKIPESVERKSYHCKQKPVTFKVDDILNFEYSEALSPIKIHKKMDTNQTNLEISFKQNRSQVHQKQSLKKKKSFQIEMIKVKSQDQQY